MKQTSTTARSVSIRKAHANDIPLLVRLEREFDRDERQLTLKERPALKPYLRTSNARYSAKRMRDWINSKDALVLVASAGPVPCGFSVAWIAKNEAIYRPKRYGFIGIMFVQRKYRGRRISSMMRDETFAWFGRRRINYICLSVISDNKHAGSIYEQWGFGNFFTVMWKTGLK